MNLQTHSLLCVQWALWEDCLGRAGEEETSVGLRRRFLSINSRTCGDYRVVQEQWSPVPVSILHPHHRPLT